MKDNLKWDVFGDLSQIPIRFSDFMSEARHGSLFQYPKWVSHVAVSPASHLALFASKKGDPVIGALIEKSQIPGTNYFFGYVHRGPVFDNLDDAIESWKNMENILVKNGCIGISIYPYWERSASKDLSEYLQSRGYSVDPEITSHSETLAFDLSKPGEDLFAGFKKTRRASIRKAIKLGILTKNIVDEKDMQSFWEMYDNMCTEKGLASSPLSFFQKIRTFAIEYPKYCCCIGAWLDNELISADICLRHGERATLWKGSAGTKYIKGVSKTDACEWQVILWAKESGASIFDMGGIFSNAKKGTQEWGINLYKRSFSKNEICLFTPQKKIFKPYFYKIYSVLKKIKKQYLRTRFLPGDPDSAY